MGLLGRKKTNCFWFRHHLAQNKRILAFPVTVPLPNVVKISRSVLSPDPFPGTGTDPAANADLIALSIEVCLRPEPLRAYLSFHGVVVAVVRVVSVIIVIFVVVVGIRTGHYHSFTLNSRLKLILGAILFFSRRKEKRKSNGGDVPLG